MKIDFQPISAMGDVDEILSVVEIKTMFCGASYLSDLEWDEDELLRSYLDELNDPEAIEDYRAEPTAGIQAAKDEFVGHLITSIEARHSALAEQSPFRWNFGQGLLLERKEHANASYSGLAYLWLSFFWLLSSGKEYLVTDEKAAFLRDFRTVFEQICCLIVAARTPTAVWYLGDSRDVGEFLRRLESVVAECGYGSVKHRSQLEKNQVGANDAGVDVIAIERHDGEIRRDSVSYLVGATVQKNDRRNKIMGLDEINRFTSYFDKKPLVTYKGILAIPFEAGPMEEQTCRDKNCIYITKQEILHYLGRPLSDDVLSQYLRYSNKKLLRKSMKYRQQLRLGDHNANNKISWV